MGCRSESLSQDRPLVLCLLLSSVLLTCLSQSSAQMPRGMDGWGGPRTGPSGELAVGRRDHTHSVFNLLDHQDCCSQDKHRGPGV